MKWIPKNLTKMIVMILCVALVSGSIRNPEAVFAESQEQIYKIYVETCDGQEIDANKLSATVAPSAGSESVTCRAWVVKSADASGGDASDGNAQTFALRNTEERYPYVAVAVDPNGVDEWSVDVTIGYDGYDTQVEKITQETNVDEPITTVVDDEVATVYEVGVTLSDVQQDQQITKDDFLVTVTNASGYPAEEPIESDIRIDAYNKASITFIQRENDTWDRSVSIGYAGYETKDIMVRVAYTFTLWPEVVITSDISGNQLFPGEKAIFALKPVNEELVALDSSEVQWSVDETQVESNNTEYTYLAREEVTVEETINVTATYRDLKKTSEFKLMPNQVVTDVEALDYKDLDTGKVYYVDGGYSINPQGYVSYSIGNGSSYALPLEKDENKDSLTKNPQLVKFYTASGAISQAYAIALDEEAPYFADDAQISVTPDEFASSRTITIPWDKLTDDGIGESTISYKAEDEEEYKDLAQDENVILNETSAAKNYIFKLQDKFGNNQTITVPVPAIDAAPSNVPVVKVKGEAVVNGSTVYTNQGLQFEFEVADDETVQGSASGVAHVEIYRGDELLDTVTNISEGYTVPYEEGNHSITVKAVDNAGNESDGFTFELVSETIAPGLEWQLLVDDQPKEADYVINAEEASKVKISVSVSDGDAGDTLDSFTYTVNGTDTVVNAEDIENHTVEITLSEAVTTPISLLATDKAGNQTSATVQLQYDLEAPEVKLYMDEEGEKEITNDSMYVTGDTVIYVTVTDNKDGATITGITREGASVEFAGGSFAFSPADASEEEEATYEITAEDAAGNVTVRSFTLKYDTNPPVIAPLWKIGEDDVTKTWLNKVDVDTLLEAQGEMSIQADIEDWSGIKTAEITGGALESTSENFNGKYVIQNFNKDIQDTYTIKACDNAGNESSASIDVKVDITAPTISCPVSNSWYTVETVNLDVTVKDKTSGVSTFTYEIYPKNKSKDVTPVTDTISWTEEMKTTTVPVTGNGYWEVHLYATDVAGNKTAVTKVDVKIDTEKPVPIVVDDVVTNVFAQYEVDKVVTTIDQLKNLFGRTKANVTLYLQDNVGELSRTIDYSDLKAITVKYGDKEYDVNVSDDVVALLDTNGMYTVSTKVQDAELKDVFRVFNFNLRDQFGKDADLKISSKLKVVKIEDNAGHVWKSTEGVEPSTLDDTKINAIILDGIAPELNKVDYNKGAYKEVDGVYYYQDTVDVGLAIEEHFFEDAYKTPVVKVSRDGGTTFENRSTALEWKKSTGDIYNSSIALDVNSEEELEYLFKVTYSDGAGNLMTSDVDSIKNNIKDGTYSSPLLILDTKAPVLESLQILAGGDTKIKYIDGAYYAATVDVGADVNVEFKIQDKYFNQDNLTVEVYNGKNKVQNPCMSEIIYDFDKVKGEATAKFTFDGETDAEGNVIETAGSYIFKITYEDNAGNKLVCGKDFNDAAQGTVDKDGIFTTTYGLVISNHVPELTAVKVNSKSGDDKKKATGPVNKKYYYMPAIDGDDVVYSVTIYDANFDPEKAVVSYTTDDGKNWTEFTDVSWTKKGSEVIKYHTANLSVDGVANKETEYRFAVKYVNRNNQKMVLNCKTENAASGELKNGRYSTTAITVVDNKAPELKSLSITNESDTKLLTNGIPSKDANTYYYNATAGGSGVKVQFTLDDNASYFDSQRLEVTFGKKVVDYSELKVKTTGRKQIFSFVITGEENKSLVYNKLKITYVDQSGRNMVLADDATFNEFGVARGSIKSGKYTTVTKIVVDRTTPILNKVEFNDPVQYTDASHVTVDKIQNKNTKLFYNDSVDVNFEITEDNWDSDLVQLKLYKKAPKETTYTEVMDIPKIKYTDSTAKFTISALVDHSADGNYYFTLKYVDQAQNKMKAGEEACDALYTKSVKTSGMYTSPILVIDTTAPVVTVDYDDTEADSLKSIDFYNKPYNATVTVKDYNFRVDELLQWANSEDKEGYGITLKQWSYTDKGKKEYIAFEDIKASKNIKDFNPTTKASGIYKLTIPFKEEGNYELGVTYVDLAGNEAEEIAPKQTVLDKSAPTLDISYKVEDTGLLDFIKYGDYGYLFAQKKVTVETKATDNVAGVHNILYDLYENKKGKMVLTNDDIEEKTEEQCYDYTFEITVPLSGNTKDFDGKLEFKVFDWADNEDGTNRNYLIESAGTYDDNASSSITIDTPSSRTIAGVKYYNAGVGSVNFTVNAAENYSGLRSVKVSPVIGSFTMSTDAMEGIPANQSMDGIYQWNVRNGVNGIKDAVDPGAGKPTEELTEADIEKMVETERTNVVKQFKHTGSFQIKNSNDLNDIGVKMEMVSNTGYMQVVNSENFVIDTTAPTVTVAFNDIPASNTNYYKDVRVATITFTERNFQSTDIVWNITNTEGNMPKISDFSNDNSGEGSSNDTTHVGTVTFAEDGVYTFGFTFMDKAGNSVAYESESFTIDLTKPVVEVSFADGNNEGALSGYYKEARTATIKVTEHNFNADDVSVVMTANDNGTAASVPAVSAFRSNGDEHTATIDFNANAEFTLDVSYLDMAGNEADTLEQSTFVVDLEDPEIEIKDWDTERDNLNYTANKGIITPTIEVSDNNFDVNNVSVTLSGYKNGIVYQRGVESDKDLVKETATTNGRIFTFNDFAYAPDVDDLYTLKVAITDKAGRTVDDKVVFSVNRYGSTYQFDEATEQLLSNYYTNEAKQLVITETNVDTLEFKELYIMRDGEKIALKENEHYTVEEKMDMDSETGQPTSWKQYIYTISAENFEQDGVYNVVIYSEDRAENVSDNRTKDKSIEFIVDKVSPLVTISGIESGGQYTMDERLVTIDVKDNMELEGLELYLDDASQPFASFTAAEIQQAGGVISQLLKSSNDLQTLIVVAIDKAQNKSTIEVKDFLITSNIFVQFYRNTPLFVGSIAVVTLGGAATIYALIFRKKEKE